MLHRFTALLLVGFGLAFAMPALSCSSGAVGTDCCPEDGSPCNETSTTDLSVASCCLTPAAPLLGTANIEAPRSIHDVKDDPGSSDPAVHSAPLLWLDAARPLPVLIDVEPSVRSDARLTYLNTGRLRL